MESAPRKSICIYRCKYCSISFRVGDELIAHKKAFHLQEIREAKLLAAKAAAAGNGNALPKSASIIVKQEFPNSDIKLVHNGQPSSQITPKIESIQSETAISATSTSQKIPQNPKNPIEAKNSQTTEQHQQRPKSMLDTKGFPCPVCGIIFNYDYMLSNHITLHAPGKKESRGFIENGNLSHSRPRSTEIGNSLGLEVHHPTEMTVNSGGASFLSPNTSTSVQTHASFSRRLPGSSTKPRRRNDYFRNKSRMRYKCEYCAQKFLRASLLRNHINNKHHFQYEPAYENQEQETPARTNSVLPESVCEVKLETSWVRRGRKWKSTSAEAERRRLRYSQLDKKFHCEECGLQFREKCARNRHMEIHTRNLPIKCSYCTASFSSTFGRTLHTLSAHRTRPTSTKMMVSQIQRKNIVQEDCAFRCNACGKPMKSKNTLWMHYRQVHGEKSFKCDHCPYRSTNRIRVRIHMERLHQNKYGPQFSCTHCGATCPSQRVLNDHLRLVHEEGVPGASSSFVITPAEKRIAPNLRYKCPADGCPYIAHIKCEIERHVKNVHEKKNKYKCKECSASYGHLRHFYSHKSMHRGIVAASKRTHVNRKVFVSRRNVPELSNYQCNFCQKYFDSRKAIRLHTRQVHGEKNFKCSYCPYVSASKNSVLLHTQRLHMNRHGPRFTCAHCGGTCASQRVLREHVQSVHEKNENSGEQNSTFMEIEEEIPEAVSITPLIPKGKQFAITPAEARPSPRYRYKCSETGCPYYATLAVDLARHVDKVHNQNNPFKCDQCSASYLRIDRLYLHKRAHDEARAMNTSNAGRRSLVTGQKSINNNRVKPMSPAPNRVPVHTFTCKSCDVSYTTNRDLRRHYTAQYHKYNEELKRHQKYGTAAPNPDRVHKQILCDYCGMAFQSKELKMMHIANKHGGVETIEYLNTEDSKVSFVKNLNLKPKYVSPIRLGGILNGNPRIATVVNMPNTTRFYVPEGNSAERNNSTMTITHENNHGLRITTVKFGK